MPFLNARIGKITKSYPAKYNREDVTKSYEEYKQYIKDTNKEDTSYNFLQYLIYANTQRT